MAKERPFATEAELVAAFSALIAPDVWAEKTRNWTRSREPWTQYHETADWDLLLAHPTGPQIGIEAKLTLNAKVLEQALPETRWHHKHGPDFRAVLVPYDGLQNHLSRIADHVGITVITVTSERRKRYEPGVGIVETGEWVHSFRPDLPNGTEWEDRNWQRWCPEKRCELPDYVPDVVGGHAAPVKLSEWKIKAIKLLLILQHRGSVTRTDMKRLGISETRWTARPYGFLDPGPVGYVRGVHTPDLAAQHPVTWAAIEADMPKWADGFDLRPIPTLEVAE